MPPVEFPFWEPHEILWLHCLATTRQDVPDPQEADLQNPERLQLCTNGNANAVISACESVKLFVLYNPSADRFDVAAAYAYYIAVGHVFSNGNKRCAFMASLVFLSAYPDFEIERYAARGYDRLIERMVEGEITRDQLAHFLRNN